MTVFYNLELIDKEAGGHSVKFVQLFTRLAQRNYMPKNNKEKCIKKLIGSSFLLAPNPLLTNKYVDINYKVQYIKLAAYRDYALYKLYKATSLPLSYFPDIDMDKIKHNPLLHITATDIQFKYES
jgi:hypothetical protein